MAFLNGWKSYIGFALIGLSYALAAAKVDPAICTVILGLGTALAGMGIAHKLAKMTK